jgi:hypothetical protein
MFGHNTVYLRRNTPEFRRNLLPSGGTILFYILMIEWGGSFLESIDNSTRLHGITSNMTVLKSRMIQ